MRLTCVVVAGRDLTTAKLAALKDYGRGGNSNGSGFGIGSVGVDTFQVGS